MNIEQKEFQFTEQDLDGFDPLLDLATPHAAMREVYESSVKRDVLNILRSYTGVLDCFAEALQNAIDALDKRYAQDKKFEPKIWIEIDTRNSIVKVTDNGTGMNIDEFMLCLRPSVSFKRGTDARGHKGVGATFLAYGYSYLRLQTKTPNGAYAISLRDGRAWIEDERGNVPKPKFAKEEFDSPELANETSGTTVEIGIEQSASQRPRFSWLGLYEASLWLQVLRLKTPLGGVYIQTPEMKPTVSINVLDQHGVSDQQKAQLIDFLYPHEFSNVIKKTKDIDELNSKYTALTGSRQDRINKFPATLKKLDCIWQVWEKNELLSEDWTFSRDFDDSKRELVEKHQISVYGCFMRSRTVWESIQRNELKIRPQWKVIEGGLQLASDYMVQGELRTIPLTTAAGYAANAFIIVHFRNGNPDMGRKVFQPELTELAEDIAKRAVAEFRKWSFCLKADTGAKAPDPTLELHQWKVAQDNHAKSNPLSLQIENTSLPIVSEPQEEQDVIALFNQLLGMGVIRGLKIYSTEYNERYDGIFAYDYKHEQLYFDEEDNPFGIDNSIELPKHSAPLVLEYKFSLDGLIRDIANGTKNPSDIDLVICWSIDDEYRSNYDIHPYLVDQEGNDRKIFGVTHQLIMGQSQTPLCPIISLKDLIGYLTNKENEIARQKATYWPE